jgi:hypothetical protein
MLWAGTKRPPNPLGSRCKSEANAVIANFHGLTQSQQQNILNFLRSL